MAAAYNGHDRVVELLLGRHDVELGPNGEGETALYLAEIRGHAGAAELLRGSMLTGSYERETCVACQVSQGCQMAKFDPFLSWIAPGWRAWGRNPRKGRDQILQRSVAEP